MKINQNTVIMHFFQEVEKKYQQKILSTIKKFLKGKHHSGHPFEINFLLTLLKKLPLKFEDNVLSSQALEEALKGGHLRFDDNGSLYAELVEKFKQGIKARYSSHASCQTQYSFSGLVLKEVLFGVYEDSTNKKRMTWLQMEKHSTTTLMNLTLHMIDYLVYKVSKKNIGPCGSSIHTDSNPLIINRF